MGVCRDINGSRSMRPHPSARRTAACRSAVRQATVLAPLLALLALPACNRSAPEPEQAVKTAPTTAAPLENQPAESGGTKPTRPPNGDVLIPPRTQGPIGNADSEGWLKALRQAHALADSAASSRQRREAIQTLQNTLALLPNERSNELLWVGQDLQYRIARLELAEKRPAQALAAAERGLTLTNEPSLARSNLYLVKGRAFEKLSRKLDAVEAYHQALIVNEILMKRSLGEDEQ